MSFGYLFRCLHSINFAQLWRLFWAAQRIAKRLNFPVFFSSSNVRSIRPKSLVSKAKHFEPHELQFEVFCHCGLAHYEIPIGKWKMISTVKIWKQKYGLKSIEKVNKLKIRFLKTYLVVEIRWTVPTKNLMLMKKHRWKSSPPILILKKTDCSGQRKCALGKCRWTVARFSQALLTKTSKSSMPKWKSLCFSSNLCRVLNLLVY